MQFVDTHAHIYSRKFSEDVHEMVARSFESGVERIYMPNIDSESIDSMLALEDAYPGRCFSMMGVHPCSIKEGFESELKIAEEWLRKRKFAAIGEIGTDLYWDKALIDYQKEAFTIQCQWAKEYGLPIVIHCRESIDLTIDLVESLKDEQLNGVFHCFTGSANQAKRILELGFFLGIGGVSTFKNGGLDAVLPQLGANGLVLETDSPYLAPVPHRGKRNEPSYIPIIAQRVSELTGLSLAEVAETTTRNADQLFSYHQ
jgi:TatD DNase family protein